jgi:hypothetical protein
MRIELRISLWYRIQPIRAPEEVYQPVVQGAIHIKACSDDSGTKKYRAIVAVPGRR